ncbi:MAG: hypothetical protein IPG43_01890 [Proteobacteria bacterium]|nr:hypothetical protein [Pseudomonadota bacterium]
MGLAKIQDGQDVAGRIELENAIAVDPLQSILRSYLGRAYLEEGTCRIFRLEHHCAVFSNRSIDLATEQLELARALDTQDPTPELYAAAVSNANNRPSEALDRIEASMKKNHNRAVYRSRLLLDRDLAARGVSLALAYDRLGFKHRGLQMAAASVNSDPSNYSAHRFLADSYQNSRRLGVATASEILQYQLLQPVNANPVRPQLSQTDLKLSDRIGPPNASFNEYHRAFQGDGAHVVGSYSIASDDTSSSEILASGAYKGFSASIGQFLASGDGYRENNDFDISVKEAFFQHEINNELSALVDLQDRSSVEGDRFTPFNSEGTYEDIRIRISRSAARFGMRYQPTPNLTMVATHLGASRRETQKLQANSGAVFRYRR